MADSEVMAEPSSERERETGQPDQPRSIQGLEILKDITVQVLKDEDWKETLNRSKGFVRKRDYFESMAALPSITSLLSDGTSSGDNLDKTEIRPHPSAASQNLINVSTSNETNNSETLHVTKTSSDTFLHTKAAKDAASSSSVHSEGGDPTSPPLVRKTSSTPQLHKWGTQSSDSGRSSAVVSPKQDSANTQDTLTKASQHLEDAVSDDLQTDDLEDPSGNLGNGTINNKSGDNENHDNDHVETDNSFSPTDSYQRVSRSLDGDLFGSTSTDSRRESLSDLSIHRPDSFVYIRSQVYQNPDDALNLSRGAGLPGEQMASADSNKRSHHGSASSDIRNFMVDKEVIESQLRKLQVENSTLHTENKLLKEKYNRSQVKVRQVESQLLAAQKEAEEQHSELQRESQEHSEQDRWRLEEEIARLKREVQRLKAENASLQKQLDANKHNANLHKQFTDRSLVIESYKIQVTSITEELRRAKQLIHESEAAREAEVEKRQEASAQVVKLTQMKALLQQEIENSAGGTVAQKQVRSLEQRLRITEERLHQERADRAAKLSEVEESLIKQNATLQVSEKELTRKLQREKDRSKNLDRKYRDARDQNEKLQLESFEKPSFLITNNNNNTYSQLNGSLANKSSEDVNSALTQIREELSLEDAEDQEVILSLWQQRQTVAKQLKDLQMQVDDLDLDLEEGEGIKEGLKKLREEKFDFEEHWQDYQDNLQDSYKNRQELEAITNSQIHDLLQEKHNLRAKLRNVEDANAAITAENQSLHHSLNTSSAAPSKPTTAAGNPWAAQVESLKCDVVTTRGDLERQSRSSRLMESELESLRKQLAAKERALDEALEEMRLLSGFTPGSAEAEQQRMRIIEKLNAELDASQMEVALWKDEYQTACRERSHLQQEVTSLTRQVERSQVASSVHLMTSARDSDVALLAGELKEKDTQVLKLSVQYNEAENKLQRTKQLILREKQLNEDLCVQLDELQAKLRERGRAVDRLTSTETEHQVELKASRDHLATVNEDLTRVATQLKLRDLEVARQRDKIEKLERDLNQRDEILSRDIVGLLDDGVVKSAVYSGATASPEQTLTQAETRVRMLEYDREKLEHDIQHAQHSVQTVVEENAGLTSRVRELLQQLANERAQLCHMTSNKVELTQKLNICREEKDALQQDNVRLTSDLARHEVTTSQVLHKLEMEAEKATLDYEQHYHTVDAHGKQMAIELGTMQGLLQAREKEIDFLRDTVERQKQEMGSLHRKVQVLSEESTASRKDMGRLSDNLTSRLQATMASAEMAHHLNNEKTQLQLEKFQLEKNWGKERGEVERRAGEIAHLQNKLEQAEDRCRRTEQMLHQKETQFVAMETELRHVGKSVAQGDCDKRDMKAQINGLNEEIRKLTSVNGVLEQRLSNQKHVATEEKSGHQQLRAELGETTRQVEVLRQEYDIVSANLDSERKRIQTLKDQCQVEEDKVIQVEDRLKGQHLELETVKSHLVESRNTIDQYKKDKQLLYQDVQDLCNKLADRDETIGRLQHKCTNAVENLHKDYANEKTFLVEDKQRLEESLSKAKEETEELNQKLRQKEQQLDAHFRTHKELEQESRARLELESKISSLDSELHELKRSLNDVQSENNRLVEHSKETQESLSKARETNTSLKEQVRVQRDTFTKEIHELRHTLTEEKHKHETVSSDKQQEYNRVVSDSRAMEVSLSSLSEAKESLQETNRIQEKTIDALKTELNEETTSRKLADQRLESLVAQLKEIQTTRAGYDSRTADLQTNLAKVQAQLNVEKEQCRKLKREFNDLQSSSLSQETLNQTLQINVTELRAEVAALTSQLETTTQDLTGCNARLTLELKQQTEDFGKEREKLTLQAQQLSVELEKVRELIAQKNQDALQMQQEVLSLEEKLREATSQLKQAQESLNIELETREKLDQRNMELELLLARLRSKDGDDDLALFDQTRSEVSRKMQEMSRHMRDRLDQQREEEVEARNRELRRLEEYKKRITSLESALSEEQAMHIVTKTQMSSLEDDNQRLRQQLQAARKKATTNTDSDRSKSRMEEINEIILRSQTRAQQLLASGAYGEDPLRTLSPSRDFMATAPPTVFVNVSPEQRTYDPNKSLGSDDIGLLMSTPEKKKL